VGIYETDQKNQDREINLLHYGDEISELTNMRPLKNTPFCSISASGSTFNPRNIEYIPVVEIFAFLDLEQN
jgi:hypothetical protein